MNFVVRWAGRGEYSKTHAIPNRCKVKQIEVASHGIDKQTL